MAWRDLDAARAEFHIDVLIAEDRDLTVHDWQDAGLADQMLIALVVRVDGHAGVAHKGFRTGGGDHQVA